MPMQTSRVSVTVRGIARLWMPHTPVPFERHYKIGDSPFHQHIRSLEDLEHHLFQSDTGDFSAVEDWTATLTIVRSEVKGDRLTEHVHSKLMRDWKDADNEYRWEDLAYPAED